MKHVEPSVFLIAKTDVNYDTVSDWLSSIGAEEYNLPDKKKGQMGALLVQLAGKRCYMSYEVGLNPNIIRIRSDLAAFIDNILKVGHGSVLEHASYSFALENVSRVLTAELNRHRAGMAISEGSMRYIAFNDISYWIPESIRDSPGDSDEIHQAKVQTRELFDKAFGQMEENYQLLLDIWGYTENVKTFSQKKKLTSLFRRIIGIGVASGGVWTGNLRALRHIFTMRCSPHAEEEICIVASMMLDEMIKAEPLIFADFQKVNGFWESKYFKV